MATLNSPSVSFLPGTSADSISLQYSADQQRIMQILHATNRMTVSEHKQLLTKVQNLRWIKLDLPLSISGRSLFHPSSETFDRPPAAINEACEEIELTERCAFVDNGDLELINSVLSEERINGAMKRYNALACDFDVEKTNAKKSLLSSQPVGFGLERDVKDILQHEAVCTHHNSFVIGSPAETKLPPEQTTQHQNIQHADERRQYALRHSYRRNTLNANRIAQETSLDSEEREDRDDEGEREDSDKEDHESPKLTVDHLGSEARSTYVAENCANCNSQPEAVATKAYTPTLVRTQLKSWLLANRLHPYPTKQEREMLCAITGLKQKQLTNWFSNARRRILPLYQQACY